MRRSISLVAVGCLSLTRVGCGELRQLRRENSALKASVQTAQSDNQRLRTNAGLLQQESADLTAKLTAAKVSETDLTKLLDSLKAEQEAKQKQVAELQAMVQGITGMHAEEGLEGTFIRMENQILFAAGQAELTPEAQQTLDATLVAYLKQHAGQKIRIDGHTDGQPIKVSSQLDNWELAAKRANAVRRYLASQGVPEEDMNIVGFGPNKPRVAPPSQTADVPDNRRVEILIVPPAGKSMEEILQQFVK